LTSRVIGSPRRHGRGNYPLWEQKGLARDVEAGRYFLPGTATGLRETILTSTLTAQPQALLIMPKPSGWPIWAAVFTAGFFLLLTIQAYGACVVSGVLAIYCVLTWCWQLDKPPPQKTADIGAGIRAPTYVNGPQGHGWWAMAITLIVAGMVWSMGVFSHLFLWSRNPADWTSAPQGLPTAWVAAGYGLSALLALSAPWRIRRDGRRAVSWSALSIVAAAGFLTAAWWTDFSAWNAAGLDPRLSGQAAMTGFFLSWQGFFTAIVAVMGLYVMARWLSGLITPERRATVQLVAMFLTYAAVQGLLSSLLVGLTP
jgi:cytochrome c oxidase subunit I+III